MPRTAPVPNIPAIPGMNPGVFVMGGGGDGGGGSGKGGKNGGGENGADGENGGEDAEGDDRCAGANATGCPVHTSDPSAGDPIELSSGRVFTLPVTDLELPGPLPFRFVRRYSARARAVDVGLGHGWVHSFAWSVRVLRRRVEVTDVEGTVVTFPRDGGATLYSDDGWALWPDEHGWSLDAADGLIRSFRPAPGEGDTLALASVRDRNDNTITLQRDDRGRLVGATDAVGRGIRFRLGHDGRIARLEVINARSGGQWVTFASYSYDDRGDLGAVQDADGGTSRYAYVDHRLVRYERPAGLISHFVYDHAGRGVETWMDYGDRADPSLAADVPALLADGRTRARGVHHVRIDYGPDGYVEVADSRKVERFDLATGKAASTASGGGVTTRVFGEGGELLALTDPVGATTTWDRDHRGRTLRQTDPLGRVLTVERDTRGMVTAEILPDGARWSYEIDGRGNIVGVTDPLGARTGYERDARGLVVRVLHPNGAVRRVTHDDHGNLIEDLGPDGVTRRYGYDFFGRMTTVVGPLGATVRSTYTTRGRQVSITDADGGVTRHDVDAEGRIIRVTNPVGAVWEASYGGLDRTVAVRTPTGDVQRYAYDREGALVEVWNEDGERHAIGRSPHGLAAADRSFDGRMTTYRRDVMGRVVEITRPHGERVHLTYDAAGQLVLREYADGTAHELEWDLCGRPIAARSPAGEFRLERDLCGRVVAEHQTLDDETLTLRHGYDVMGACTTSATSLGYQEMFERTAGSRVASVRAAGAAVAFARDAGGDETARVFDGRARMDLGFDVVGNLTHLRVHGGLAGMPAGQPDWLGPVPPGTTVDRRFGYDAISSVIAKADGLRGASEELVYDGRRRLLEVRERGVAREQFRYDGRGNVQKAGRPRRYGAGNRLEVDGAWENVWTADAKLAARKRRLADGTEEETRFRWSSSGMLEAVELPDGRRAQYTYDPLGRRVKKTVVDARGRVLASTRFLWDGDRLAQEIRAASASNPVIEERTYAYVDGPNVPWAMRVRRGDEAETEAQWGYFVLDQAGTPLAMVDRDGDVLCAWDRTAEGKHTARPGATLDAPIRMQGQYEDDETGLHYNRHRYYDPESGRYISADPIGLAGGLNEYRYGDNWIVDVDPFGLAHRARAKLDGTAVRNSNHDPSQPGRSTDFNSGWSGRANNHDPYIQSLRLGGESFGTCYRECHSEFKIMRELAPDGVNPKLKGKTLKIHGQKRSCPNCAAALEEFAETNQMRVEYTSDEDDDVLTIDHRPRSRTRGSSNRADYSSTTHAQQQK